MHDDLPDALRQPNVHRSGPDRRLIVGIFGFFFAAYLLTTSARLSSIDDKIMFDVAKSIMDNGSFSSSEPLSNRDFFVDPWFYVEGKDGKAYGKYGLGQTLAMLPLYALGRSILPHLPQSYVDWFPIDYIPFKSPDRVSQAERVENMVIPAFTSLLNPAATALSCVLVFLLAYRMGGSMSSSFVLTGIFGFATSAFPYAKYSFQHPLVTALILASFYHLFRWQETGGRWRMAASGACLGFAALTRYEATASLVVLLPYALWGAFQSIHKTGQSEVMVESLTAKGLDPWGFLNWSHGSSRLSDSLRRSDLCSGAWTSLARRLSRSLAEVGLFLVPVLLAEMVVLWFNYIRFGDPFSTGYFQEGFTASFWEGASGLLVSPGRSILLFSPPVLLGLLCLPLFARRRPPEGIVCATLVAVFFTLYAKWSGWEGGWAWGPRYPLPLLPFLCLPLIVALQARSPWPKAMAIGLSLLSLPIQLLGVATNFNDFYMERTLIQGQDFWLTVFDWERSQIPGHADLFFRGAIDLWFFRLIKDGAPWVLQGIVLVTLAVMALSGFLIWSGRNSLDPSGRED